LSSDDLNVTARGNLDARINGGPENDSFNFENATGNYKFFTNAGDDTVVDGTGNNFFDGGADEDTFIFNRVENLTAGAPDEVDTIDNYNIAQDTIALERTIAADFEVSQDGANAVITFDDGDKIVVLNQSAVLIAEDIVLVPAV
jgi:Ca2+-binding RTX toxin-like protein